jgi:hypothetical protein
VQGFFLHKPGSGAIKHSPGIAVVKSA